MEANVSRVIRPIRFNIHLLIWSGRSAPTPENYLALLTISPDRPVRTRLPDARRR